jgi:hypothetical protein
MIAGPLAKFQLTTTVVLPAGHATVNVIAFTALTVAEKLAVHPNTAHRLPAGAVNVAVAVALSCAPESTALPAVNAVSAIP